MDVKFIKENKLLFIIVMNPFIDLITGILQFATRTSFSFGGVFRILILLVLIKSVIDEYIKTQSYRSLRLFLIYSSVGLVYLLIVSLNVFFNMGFIAMTKHILYLVRYFTFPIYFISVYEIYKKNNLENYHRVLSLVAVIYSMLVTIPFITGTGFNSYILEDLSGSVGWFVGANEIGLIIGITTFSSFALIQSRVSDKAILGSILIPMFALAIVGTKAALLFFVIYSLFSLTLIYRKINYQHKKIGLVLILTLFTIIILFLPASQNLMYIMKGSKDFKPLTILLSGRLLFLENAFLRFSNGGLYDKLFGIGFLLQEKGGYVHLDVLVEMDFFDLFFRTGLIGFILIFLPVIQFFRENDKFYFRSQYEDLFFQNKLIYLLVIMVLLAFFIGHVFTAPSVIFFATLYFVMFLNKKESKQKKVCP